MKMIKNFIKLLTFGFCVGVATQNNSSALSFTDYFTLPAYACSTATFSETQLIYNSAGNFTNSNVSSWTNYPSYVVSNSAPNYRFDYSCSFAGSRPGGVSFLKPSKTDDAITIGLYNYKGGYKDVVLPKSGYLHTMHNGESVNFDNIYLGHGFIVLYTSDYSHTLQFFSDYYLEDYILFTDPLKSSLTNSSIDNFFLISFPQKKAWSFKLLEMHVDHLFKGDLGNYSVNTFPFTKSYTLSINKGSSPFPVFSSYMSASVSNWHNMNGERFYNDIGFIYSEDFVFQAPDFGGGSNDNINNDNNYFNSNIISGYNSCSNKAENLRKYLQLMGYCFWQSDDGSLISDILASNGQYNYSGDLLYCKQLSDYNKKVYNQYSDNWNSDGTFNDVNLYDFNAPFNDLVYSWFNNSLTISQSGHVEGLPTQSMCSVYNNVNAYNNEKSRIERASESITDMFGSGVSSEYIDAIKNGYSFSGFIGSITDGTSGFFNTYMFDPYLVEFNSGKNAFLDVVNVNSCSNIHQIIGNYERGNVALYGFALFLLLVPIIIL